MLLFVDNLTNSDFCYLHPSRGLLGETWLSHIELEGELDEQGMVCDFGLVKSATRQLLDDLVDHRLLVPVQADNLTVSQTAESTQLLWRLTDGQEIQHTSPGQCVTLIDTDTIAPETVARWCEQQLRRQLPDSVDKITVSFSQEGIAGPSYHYSHGLKKHAGKCQRIAHGHRSKIQILRDSSPAPDLEQAWAEKLRDSYLGTREDLAAEAAPAGYCEFAYRAAEGDFRLRLPEQCCHLLSSDSTVEHIARHIAEALKEQDPAHSYTVKAYEGVGKGAIVTR